MSNQFQLPRREFLYGLGATLGTVAFNALVDVAKTAKSRLARIHAIWALGQIERAVPGTLAALNPLWLDGDDEVRVGAQIHALAL